MKKISLFIVCMFLVSVAVNDASARYDRNDRHHGHSKLAVGGTPATDWQDLADIFSYPGTEITEVTWAPEGSIVNLLSNN